MTPAELKAARRELGLPIAWLAPRVGGVSKRSWEYWESGQRSVPDDIGPKIQRLAKALRPWLER